MIIVGLTGGIASGKSTVSKTFKEHNIPVVDADIVARQVVELGTPGLQQIKDAFGKDYLNEDETLNRSKLGELVFKDQKSLDKLNNIMDPLMREEQKKQFKKLKERGFKLAVFDAALICEMGNADKYRPLIVVACPLEIQLQRLMARNSLTKEQAMARIDKQFSMEIRTKLADYVIDTSKDIENSIKQTVKIIRKLRQLVVNQEVIK